MVTVKALAKSLGYSDYRDLAKLMKRNAVEFGGKTTGANLPQVDNGRNINRMVSAISYHGSGAGHRNNCA